MKKKLFILFILVLFLSVQIYSQSVIIDNAGLLDPVVKSELDKRISEITAAYKFDLVILTLKDIGSTDPIDFSWEFLDKMGLDGKEWDGCLLLQSIKGRDYALTASGRGSKILNSIAYDKLESEVVDHLRRNDYAGAYRTFINIWEEFLILESKGRSYNFFTHNYLYLVLGSWILALLIALITLLKWRLAMNTARPKQEADFYVVPNSLVFTKKQDNFLYSTVSKSRKQSSSSSSSGGGSSRSGGGRSSRSGKY